MHPLSCYYNKVSVRYHGDINYLIVQPRNMYICDIWIDYYNVICRNMVFEGVCSSHVLSCQHRSNQSTSIRSCLDEMHGLALELFMVAHCSLTRLCVHSVTPTTIIYFTIHLHEIYTYLLILQALQLYYI